MKHRYPIACFNIEKKQLSDDGSLLHIVDIEDLSSDLESFMDEQITLIHSANEYNLLNTKKILRKTFETTTGSEEIPDVKMGAIAEFFIHLYLASLGFKQECLFRNLEELHGIKKGHDGYYSFEKEEWLMESKSAKKDPDHLGNVKKAYKDISDKVSGRSGNKNNPWDNALSHAKLAKADEDIIANIKRLSEDFLNDVFYNIDEFNIIPSSTIFFNGEWKQLDHDDLFKKIDGYISNMKYKKLNIVCVTQKTVALFLNYLKE